MVIMKLLAYVPILTPRIRYIFNFIFNDVLKTQIGFSSNLAEFKASALPKISYANQPVGDELFFKNTDLLLSHAIVKTSFKTTAFGDTIVPFAVTESTLPFDLFAASFYFISRYEEYLPFHPDADGHYPPEYSLQSKLKLLQIPVIDAWALILKNILLKKHPKLFFEKKNFGLIPLICMYPGTSSSDGLFKSTINLIRKVKQVLRKDKTEDRKTKDIQAFVNSIHEPYRIKARFFFKPSQDEDHECDGQINLPQSYLQLLKTGTVNDYRMGYKHTIGFRAGTCTPFPWYDLQLEKTTHLFVHPIAINDGSLSNDKHIRIAHTLAQWKNIVDTVKLLEGKLYITWHQDTLVNSGKGRTARKLYTEMLSNFLSLPNDIRPQ